MNDDTLTPAEYFKHALSRFRKEDFPGAERFCSQAIEAGLNTADVYYLRGKSRHFAGNLAGAVEDYSNAIDLDSHHALAYQRRSEVRLSIGDEAGAQEDFLSAIQSYPNYHQQVLAPPSGYLPVSHRIPVECWTLRHKCLEFYEKKIDEARAAHNPAAELEYWQAFMAIGGTIDYGVEEVIYHIQRLQAKLNLLPE